MEDSSQETRALERGMLLRHEWSETILEVLDPDGIGRYWVRVVKGNCDTTHKNCKQSVVSIPIEDLDACDELDKMTALVVFGSEIEEDTSLRYNGRPCGLGLGWKVMPPELERAFERTVKVMLHAARDTMRIRGIDTRERTFDLTVLEAGEAFGMMRTLEILGYGYFGSDNCDAVVEKKSDHPKHNLKWWNSELETEVLKEEGFCYSRILNGHKGPGDGSNECAHCMEKYITAWPGSPAWERYKEWRTNLLKTNE